jgi:hypothetical protein
MVSFLNLIFIQFICITIFILKTRNTDSQVTYWIAMSDYDLKTAKCCLQAVIFMSVSCAIKQ